MANFLQQQPVREKYHRKTLVVQTTRQSLTVFQILVIFGECRNGEHYSIAMGLHKQPGGTFRQLQIDQWVSHGPLPPWGTVLG